MPTEVEQWWIRVPRLAASGVYVFFVFSPVLLYSVSVFIVVGIAAFAALSFLTAWFWKHASGAWILLGIIAVAGVWAVPVYLFLDGFPKGVTVGFIAMAVPIFGLWRRRAATRFIAATLVMGAIFTHGMDITLMGVEDGDIQTRDRELRRFGHLVLDTAQIGELSQLRRITFHPDGDRLYVTRGLDFPSRDPGAVEIRRSTGAWRLFGPMPAAEVLVDAPRNRVLVAHTANNVIVRYDAGTLKEVDRFPHKRAGYMTLSEDGRSMWLLSESSPPLTRWSLDPPEPFVFWTSPDAFIPTIMTISQGKGLAYIVSGTPLPFNRLAAVDARTLETRAIVSLGWHGGRALAVDERKGFLYVATPMVRGLQVYAMEDLSFVKSIPAPLGGYAVCADDNGRVYVGSFVSGQVWVVDPDTGEVLERAFVGRRVRHLALDPVSRNVYGSSALGVFEIDTAPFAPRRK